MNICLKNVRLDNPNDVLICIPAYNEEGIIGNLVKEILKDFDNVVVCDDGSTDKTYEILLSSGAVVLKHNKNKGKGAALKTLFEYAKNNSANIIVTIDGDGQFLPNEIFKLVKPIQDKTSDVVIGFRFDNENNMPHYRKMGNKILDKVTNLASDISFRDTQSGFRAYSKEAIKKISFSSDGFAADSEILIDASKKDLKIVEEKITVIYNTGYKTSTRNPLSHSTSVIMSLIELISVRRPLLFVGLPGIIFASIGVIFSMYMISLFNDVRYFSVPLTLVSLGTLILGTLLILISVVLFSININFKKIKQNL